MKTFTNLAHRAFKKCASLGTINKKRYYLFIITMLLTLGAGTAWAESIEINTTSSGVNGSYRDYEFDVNSITFGCTQWMKNNNIQAKKSTTNSLYNVDAIPGTITSIVVKQTGTARAIKVYGGTSTKPTTQITSPSTAAEMTFDFTGKDYTYFSLTTPSNACYFDKITINYTPSSSGGDPEPPTPATQYTIKWHTAKGVTTDVTLNEGATITKPATDPTMTGYEFRGWTKDCSVASDGSDFTALTDFGTADSDKDFYAVFAVATTTGGGEATTGNVTMKYSGTTTANMTAGNNAATVGLDANEWSVVPTKGSASNMPGLNKDGDIRLYGHASGGNYLTITSKSYTITSAEITYTSNSYNNGKFYVNGVETAAGNINSKEFVIKNANSGTTQVRIKTLVINYTSGSAGTTTYSNYITTCASDIEYVELGDDFKWSAEEAEVTIDATDNEFPILKNTHNVPVKYSSSDDAIATIVDGTVTLKKEGTVTITAKYQGGTSAGTGKEYKAKTVTYSLKVNKAAPVASGTTYVKVTSTAGITDGDYLIVYEAGNVAFDGSLTSLDATKNTIDVEINNNTIAGTNYIDLSTFTIDATAGTIKSKSGYYIGKTATGNGLNTNQSTKYTNTITIDANKNAVVTSSGGPILRYNKAADQLRFRYFGSGQEAIALYKKASSHTLTYGTCTNGSVSADVADGATVLSGTTITLSNTPATNYKLTAYNIYKTGEESTKVTVADDNTFIMPEFDVTISATFELAKTLTGIEITTTDVQKTFWQGETFNSTGLKVTAHFNGAADEDVTDKVTVTGNTATSGTQTVTVSFKEGEVTKDATYTITIKAIPNTKETAYSVADAYDIIDKLTTAEGVYIKGIVSQVDEYLTTYKSITYWISADGTTTNQLQVYSGKGLEKADFANINGVSKSDQVIVCGNLKKYNETYEFDKNNYLAEHTKTTKAEPELSYTTTEYNVNLGDAFTAPTLNNPHTLAVTYSSNNEDVATVGTDGAVIIKAAGTVTITASFAGNDDYVAGEASYTINITDPSVSSVTFDAAVDIPTEGLILTKNGISMEFTAGTMNNGEEYRCNASNTMTISYTDGFITKVVLNCLANGTTKYGPGCFTTTIGSYSYEEKVGTWTGEAKSVIFTSGQQVRMTTVTVYYKQDKRANSELAWSEETVNLTVGEIFTAPTFTNPNNVTGIEFTSSNDALATVSNAGVISLVSGKTGTATITATFEGDENYKAAEVTCTIIVNHKSEDVVILAKCKDQYYALVAKNLKSDVLKALPVEYVNGKIYNVETEDQASIIWKRVVVDGKTTFKNGDNYLSAVNSAALNLATEACEWVFEGDMYKIEGSTRTILYYTSTGGFKNYATTNMSKDGVNGEYSSAAITVAPVFADGDAYHRTTTPNKFGTICLPFGSTNYTGATFYEFVGSETGKVYLGSVTTLEAGVPYIFEASAAEVAVYGDGTTAATPGNSNGLHGTFTDETPVAVGNYILLNNELRPSDGNAKVNANRAYLVMSEVPDGAPQQMPGRRYIGMSVQGENEATGFDNIQLPNANSQKLIINGQLIIIRNGEKFNAQGQKL